MSNEFHVGHGFGGFSTECPACAARVGPRGVGGWQPLSDFVAGELPTFDPRNFGAVGDGVADDTEAVQASFDAGARAVLAGATGWCLGAPGTYRITRPITSGVPHTAGE